MRIATVKNTDGSFEIYFNQLGSWDDCTLIEHILVKENYFLVTEEKDMITDKDVTLKSGEIQFLLRHHYMLGNFLYTENPNDVPILEQLANNVIDSIKQKLKDKGLL